LTPKQFGEKVLSLRAAQDDERSMLDTVYANDQESMHRRHLEEQAELMNSFVAATRTDRTVADRDRSPPPPHGSADAGPTRKPKTSPKSSPPDPSSFTGAVYAVFTPETAGLSPGQVTAALKEHPSSANQTFGKRVANVLSQLKERELLEKTDGIYRLVNAP